MKPTNVYYFATQNLEIYHAALRLGAYRSMIYGGFLSLGHILKRPRLG